MLFKWNYAFVMPHFKWYIFNLGNSILFFYSILGSKHPPAEPWHAYSLPAVSGSVVDGEAWKKQLKLSKYDRLAVYTRLYGNLASRQSEN